MTMRLARVALASVVAGAIAAPAGAHRLDEYLQATRVTVERSRAGLDLSLTPGAAVAPRLIASIDTDADGRLSDAERAAYAREVLQAMRLTLDDRPLTLALEDAQFPSPAEMADGVGIIRLRAAASFAPLASGRHQLAYVNGHRSDISVYLVNALVPDDARIAIAGQARDPRQRSMRLEYDVRIEAPWTRALWLAGGLGMIGALSTARRGRTRRTSAARSGRGPSARAAGPGISARGGAAAE